MTQEDIDNVRNKISSFLNSEYLTDDEAKETIKLSVNDALTFSNNLKFLQNNTISPTVYCGFDDGIIILCWKQSGKEAIVEFDGKNGIGYCTKVDNKYMPGLEIMTSAIWPKDLFDYVKSM